MKRRAPEPIKLSAPKGADHWHQRLSLAGLTLLPGSFDRIHTALRAPNSSADQVARALTQDPAACLHFFLRANRLLTPAGNEVHGLSHLISLLGFPQVSQILHKLPVADEPLPAYWRQLQQSLLRGQLAQRLPLASAGLASANVYFAALFSDLPQWLRWHYAAKEQTLCNGLALNLHIGPRKAEAMVFGTQLTPWLTSALKQQPLPHSLRAALGLPAQQFQQALLPLARNARRHLPAALSQRQSLTLLLIQQLVSRFYEAPSDKRTRRVQDWLAHLLHCDSHTVGALLHSCAAQLPSIHPALVNEHPARRLLCHWPRFADLPIYSLPRPQTSAESKAPANQAEAEQATGAPSRLLDNRFIDPDLVRAGLKALAEGSAALSSLNTIFQAITNTLQHGMGMEQGGLLVNTQAESWQFKCPFDQHALLPDKLAQSTLLERLSAKPAAVLINTDNRSALLAQMPTPLSDALAERDAVLISLFLGQKPIAILLAAEADLSPPRVQACKRLAQAAQKAIARLARKFQRRAAS